MSGADDQSPTVPELRRLLSELLTRWEQAPEQRKLRRDSRPSDAQVRAVIGLAAHAHRLGHVVATLVDQGFNIETAPTVRTVFEYGVTLQWIVQYGDDAMWAVATEAQRNRTNLRENLREMQKIMTLPGADEFASLLDLRVELQNTAAEQAARVFYWRCKDLVSGTAYYFGFRVLSNFVHPGPDIAGAYVDDGDSPDFLLKPRQDSDTFIWLSNTCCGLVWAARAADMLDEHQPRREFLWQVAESLGIPAELPLTTAAQQRRESDQAERKR